MSTSPLIPSVLELLRHTRQEELDLSEGLSDAERTEIGTLDHWSAKDVVAHITAWKEWRTRRLEAAASGETPPDIEDMDRENARTFERYRLVSLSEVEQEAARISDELVAVVERFPEEHLLDPKRYAWSHGQPLVAGVLVAGVRHPCAHLTGFYLERDDPQRAVQLQETLVATVRRMDLPTTFRAVAEYDLARVYAATGRPDQALVRLSDALQLDPQLAEQARQHPDLEALRELPAFQALMPA
jgi:hypothetical protein